MLLEVRKTIDEIEAVIKETGKKFFYSENWIYAPSFRRACELIKAKVLENSGYTAKEAAEEISDAIDADIVCTVGNKFVLYKKSSKKSRIELP